MRGGQEEFGNTLFAHYIIIIYIIIARIDAMMQWYSTSGCSPLLCCCSGFLSIWFLSGVVRVLSTGEGGEGRFPHKDFEYCHSTN